MNPSRYIFGRLRKTALAACCMSMLTLPAHALSDEEIIRGFNLTVFGAEISNLGFQARYVHKFRDEVRFKIHNLSRKDRSGAVKEFVNSLPSRIAGLQTRVVDGDERANFNIYVVDRADYLKTVRENVERRANARAPGRCLVKSRFTTRGIIRSDAVIVSDEGEALFKRCLIEEILQGLGPLNEHTSLRNSVFNDTSRHTRFTLFDQFILNMLYDERVKNGASPRSVNRVLDEVLADTRRRLGR